MLRFHALQASLLAAAAPTAFAASWRVRVAKSDWTVEAYFAVSELEFLTGADCDAATKVDVSHEDAIESGSVWGIERAFDGSTAFDSRWNGRAASDWWEHLALPSANLRYLGAAGLPGALGCVRLFAPDVYMPAGKDFAVAVERLDEATARWVGWGPSWGAVHHLISPNVWNEIVLRGPAHALCARDEHVVDGRCVGCPAGLTNAAGDDTATPGGTACDVVAVDSFDAGEKLATRCSTKRAAREMHTASCGADKLLVSYTTQGALPGYPSCSLGAQPCAEEPDETMPWRPKGCIFPAGSHTGHVALYQRRADGRMVELQRASLPFCEEMGTVTASADCSVLAALCITRAPPADVPNLTNDLLEENRGECAAPQKACQYPGGWYEDPVTVNKPDWVDPSSAYFDGAYTGGAWFYVTRKAYLLEWRHGGVAPSPDAAALVNGAIGGARYGNWELSLDAAASLYFLNLKVTAARPLP